MLKIKDGIDLKELEEFNILEFADLETAEFTQYVGYVIDENKELKYVIETDENRVIQTGIYKEGLDLLYDLIKADMVEKVEE